MLVDLAKSVRPDLERVWVFDDVMTGLKAATDTQKARVVLCGSLYLLGNFLGRDSS
jgi:folylpolyglutamate synthase/dihydropteroate synthase